MEEEIEDIVGDVKLTDSQKSVTKSNVYSPDFTDSSPERNNSSGKETYVIEQEDSDSESFQLHNSKSVINLSLYKDEITQCNIKKINRAASTSVHDGSFVSQEIFTQTSKTIIELAELDNNNKYVNCKSLDTQTSFISITNKTMEYRIQVSNTERYDRGLEEDKIKDAESYANKQFFNTSLDDGSSKFPVSGTDNCKSEDDISSESEGKILNIIDGDSRENIFNGERNKNVHGNSKNSTSSSSSDSDIEDDSLMECRKQRVEIDSHSDTSEIPNSVDNDVEELYSKLSESIDLHNLERYNPQGRRRYSTLTPLTEESTIKKDNFMDITPDVKNIVTNVEDDKDVLFTSNTGTKVRILPKEEGHNENWSFKLPPIINRSCPNSPHLNFLFTEYPSRPITKAGSLSTTFDDPKEKVVDRWEIGKKELASGESTLITDDNDPAQNKNNTLHLPPIHIEGHVTVKVNSYTKRDNLSPERKQDPISVKQKIKELKINRITNPTKLIHEKRISSASNSGNVSPSSGSPSRRSPDSLCGAATRGCEVLCVELLKRLKSASWVEVVDTLEELPRVMEKFWGVITEHRIADLIRHVCSHIESARTQVARSACDTLASILKTTNYTKKPDFYEAVSILLMKTGCFSRPVRRAANVALDSIVCGVELSHAVTAICVHGVDHKSALVRCATSRLLVVSCALAGGGRELLRSRPPSAVCARKHALQALAEFLSDKNTETRKYAERLYSMLRPLNNFEAYYLTDVGVEVATRQMKKYDQLLLCGPSKGSR